MDNCQDTKSLFPPTFWESLKKIPAFRYLKAPVDDASELYEKYPTGNEKGTFAFVHNENTFYTYHPRGWHRGEWKPINADTISSFFEIDAEFLNEGDILVYDNTKKKFVVKSGNVWNKIKTAFSQVTKFLNEVDTIPTDESDSGIYYIHNEDNEISFRALYIVLAGKSIKIFSNTDYYTKESVESMLEDERYYVDAQIQRLEENMSNLGIRKTYSSYDDMQSDANNPIGDNGEVIRAGELVMVVNLNDSSKDGVYRYKIVNTVKSWEYASGVGIVGELNKKADRGDTTKNLKEVEDEIPFNGIISYSKDDEEYIVKCIKKIQVWIPSSLSDKEVVLAVAGMSTAGKVVFQWYNKTDDSVIGNYELDVAGQQPTGVKIYKSIATSGAGAIYIEFNWDVYTLKIQKVSTILLAKSFINDNSYLATFSLVDADILNLLRGKKDITITEISDLDNLDRKYGAYGVTLSVADAKFGERFTFLHLPQNSDADRTYQHIITSDDKEIQHFERRGWKSSPTQTEFTAWIDRNEVINGNIKKSLFYATSVFGSNEEKLIQCIDDVSIVDYVGSRRFAFNVAGFSNSLNRVLFYFKDIDTGDGFNFDLTDITVKPTGIVSYRLTKDYKIKVEFNFNWDKYSELFTDRYNSGENLNLIVQSVHVAEKTIYGDSELAKVTYLNSSKITDQELFISKCVQRLKLIDWQGATEYRLRSVGWSNSLGYPVFYFLRMSDNKIQEFNLSTITVKPTGIVPYNLDNKEIQVSFYFDWDTFSKLFSNRYVLDDTHYLSFMSEKTDHINRDLFVSRNFLQNSTVTYDNVNIAKCIQNLQIYDYKYVSRYQLYQQGWSNGTAYPIFYFQRVSDGKIQQFNLSTITVKPTGIQPYRLTNNEVSISFEFDWDTYAKYFTNRYGGNSGLYVQSKSNESTSNIAIGNTIPMRKGAKIMLVGASFASSTNGWFELACAKLGIAGINQAVGGSIIIENVVDRMMDANDTQPHGSLFMVDGVDVFEEVEAFAIMHTHLWDVYLEESNPIEYYKAKYEAGGEFTRAEAFDYVIQQYRQWCAEYTKTITIQGGFEDVLGSKDCNILLCSHWHQSRDIYNDSSKKLAYKFGLSYCAFDQNIGFSNTDFVSATVNTDTDLTPTLGIYHQSVLYSHYSEVTGGTQPRGKTEDYGGITFGWHPQTRSTSVNYGFPQEDDGYYYPAIQYKLASVFMKCIEII